MKLLLHACCGPCSLEPVRLLLEEGHDLTIFYANSNIAPASEYTHRLNTLLDWASSENIPVVEGSYNPLIWESSAGRIGDAALAQTAATQPSLEASSLALAIDPKQREARCRACYRLRFEEAALFAAQNGFDALGTTLSVSPYQYTSLIEEELHRAAQRENIDMLFQDYRPHYPQATSRSKAQGMYRQDYCGCRLSDAEAKAERALRKQKRDTERQAKQAEREQCAAQETKLREEKKRKQLAYEQKQAQKRAILKSLREQNASSKVAKNR